MSQTTTQNEKLRALLAEARTTIHQVICNDALQDWACESVEDEPSMEDILRDMRGRIDAALAESVETGAVKGLENERDHFKAMLRERAEELVAAREEIERLRADKGALDGIIDRLERTIDGPQGLRPEVERLRAEVDRLRWDNKMACENTPNPACQYPGCETARERADRGETGP